MSGTPHNEGGLASDLHYQGLLTMRGSLAEQEEEPFSVGRLLFFSGMSPFGALDISFRGHYVAFRGLDIA